MNQRTSEVERFGHYPNPVEDFCVEVDKIEGLVYGVRAGNISYQPVKDRIFKAMQFRVGGVEAAVQAKARLRIAGTYLDS